MTHNYIEILFDYSSSSSSDEQLETSSYDSYDSGTREKLTKPVTSSNKSSTFLAKHKSDNEETPLKQPHQGAFALKRYILERIKRFHIKCGFLDTEHLSMLPINLLNQYEVPDVNVENVQNLYNAYCTLIYFLLRQISIVGIPKSTVLVIIFRFFMWPLSLINTGPRNIIHLQCFKMAYKKTRSYITGKTDDGIPSPSSDSAMTSKIKKNRRAIFKIQMKNIVYFLNQRMMHFLKID